MTTTTSELDIRDIEMGASYWVVIDAARGNRCVNSESAPMFRAAWLDKASADAAARRMGRGFKAAQTVKS
jgi:hypothetical protein